MDFGVMDAPAAGSHFAFLFLVNPVVFPPSECWSEGADLWICPKAPTVCTGV